MQAQIGDPQPLGVERADDLGEVAGALGQPHRDAVARRGGGLAEAVQDGGQPLAVAGVVRDRFDARAPDLGLQLGGRALGDDLAVVDDPDAVGEHVGLLEVLRGEKDRHAVAGEPAHLVPQRGAALWVEAGGRLVEEQQPRTVHERQRRGPGGASCRRSSRRPCARPLR